MKVLMIKDVDDYKSNPLNDEEINLFTWIFDRALRPNYSEATEYDKVRITELLKLRRELNI